MIRRWKCALDLAVVIPALVLTAPLTLLIAICVRLSLGKPVLLRQQRPGLGGRPFTLYKFRTMRSPNESFDLDDTARLTRFGILLRQTSLDELPELWNVLRGDMSLVGPRPLLTQYLDRYSAEQHRRHEVVPGITGWAQVNGRNAISWEQRLALDVWYVDHQSFLLDLRILFVTIPRLLKRKDIHAAGHPTMPEFMGSTPERTLRASDRSPDAGFIYRHSSKGRELQQSNRSET